MGAGGGVAHQSEVLMRPALAQHAGKVQPGGAADVTGIRHQGMVTEMAGEDPLAGGDGLFLGHFAEAELLPSLLAAFDDERRRHRIELVCVSPDPAVLGLLEDEGEGVVELLVGAKPHELAFAQVDVGPEDFGEGAARPRVEAVGGNDEIMRLHVGPGILDLGLEAEVHAKLAGSLLQDQEEPLAADPAEAVAGGDGADAAVDDRDVVPIGEVAPDGGGADRVVPGQVVEGLGGQHHAPSERVVGAVALQDCHLVRGVDPFHRDGKIQPGRTAAENRNLHRATSSLPAGYYRAVRKLFQA